MLPNVGLPPLSKSRVPKYCSASEGCRLRAYLKKPTGLGQQLLYYVSFSASSVDGKLLQRHREARHLRSCPRCVLKMLLLLSLRQAHIFLIGHGLHH